MGTGSRQSISETNEMTETEEEIIRYLDKLDPHHAPCDPISWRVSDRVSVRRRINGFEILIYEAKLSISEQKMHQTTTFEFLERLAELDPDIAAKLAGPME